MGVPKVYLVEYGNKLYPFQADIFEATKKRTRRDELVALPNMPHEAPELNPNFPFAEPLPLQNMDQSDQPMQDAYRVQTLKDAVIGYGKNLRNIIRTAEQVEQERVFNAQAAYLRMVSAMALRQAIKMLLGRRMRDVRAHLSTAEGRRLMQDAIALQHGESGRRFALDPSLRETTIKLLVEAIVAAEIATPDLTEKLRAQLLKVGTRSDPRLILAAYNNQLALPVKVQLPQLKAA